MPRSRNDMKTHHPMPVLVLYVGFLNGRPDMRREAGTSGPIVLAAYRSKAAAQQAYTDVRRAEVRFDLTSPGRLATDAAF